MQILEHRDSSARGTPKRRIEAVRDRIIVVGIYKQKANKVRPINTSNTNSSAPRGVLN